MKNPFKRRRQFRGKSKSPEMKMKEQRASVDAFLLQAWKKRLKDDPVLADRIAEQKYGAEAMVYGADNGDYDDAHPHDMLGVLREAREVRELVKDELGVEGNRSWVKDIVEIMKALPAFMGAIGKMNPAQLQQLQQQGQGQAAIEPRPEAYQIPLAKVEAPTAEAIQQPDVSPVKLERLLPLLELEPEEAWHALNDTKEIGWVNYLKQATYEQLEQTLKAVAEANPEVGDNITNFLQQKHRWLQDLVAIAHGNA